MERNDPTGDCNTHPQGIALKGSHRRCDGKGRVAEKRDLGMIGTRAIENPAPQ